MNMEVFKTSIFFLVTCLVLVSGIRVENPCKSQKKIPCDNGQCIGILSWCDMTYDCTDGSDEKYCERSSFDPKPNNGCNEKHFVCEDRMCVPASVRCDGNWDCFDSTDEDNCDTIEQTVSHTRETEPEYSPVTTTTTTTTTTTPAPRTTTDYYNRRIDESYDSNRVNYRYYPSSAPPYAYHPSVSQNHNNDYNNRHPYQNNHNRGSDTIPGSNFPSSQHSYNSGNLPGTSSQSRPNRQSTPTRYRNDRRSQLPSVSRSRQMVFPARSILHAPQIRPAYSSRFSRRYDYSHFYFTNNYTEDLSYKFRRNIKDARNWLLDQRDESYNWDKDTPRALIALSLITNSFKSDTEDNELMRKSLQAHLGIKLLRNDSGIERMSTTKLAQYISALFATCQDPRDFLGINLAEILYKRQYYMEQHQKFINPLVLFSLCLADYPINVEYLKAYLQPSLSAEIAKDIHILATTAMACALQQNPHDNAIRYALDGAARSLLNQMNRTDGSFGSKYSTALAAQALMSINMSLDWDFGKTMEYLARQQRSDGSFGDMQSTYYTLIALSGRSLLHLRNTLCDPVNVTDQEPLLDPLEPQKTVLYSLRVDYPEAFSAAMQVTVPENANFFDIMRVAAKQDPRFKFNYRITNGQLGVHTIANIPNDPERGTFWSLYWLKSTNSTLDFNDRYTRGMKTIIPENGDELVFWYLKDL